MKYTLSALLKGSFEKNSERIAICTSNGQITYGDLNQIADRLGILLAQKGHRKGSCMACLVSDPSIQIYCLLACIKRGWIYMPVDPHYPEERIADMLQSGDVCAVVFDQIDWQRTKRIQSGIKHDVDWFDFEKVKEPLHTTDFWEEVEDTDPAYIYFTSGSQGKPKGILGQVKGLVHFIVWEATEFGIDHTVKVAQLTPPCHDPFLRDVLLPLYMGGMICIPPGREELLDSAKIAAWIMREKITLIHCTPSLFSVFASEAKTSADFPYLHYVFFAGEPLVPNLISDWFHMFSSRMEFINLYGPTETTLAKVFHRVVPDDLKRKTVPVGMCLPGTRILVVNNEGRNCKKNQAGEVWIRTPYRSLGYLDEALTAQNFIRNPFSALEDDIIYKTGDLGRILDNGNLEVIGRIDRQVKIRGHRVELTEIENALIGFQAIKQAAVVYNEKNGILYAFIQLPPKSDGVEKSEIAVFLGEKLPEYMIPGVLTFVPVIPMNDNAKIDYHKLYLQAAKQKKEYIAPATPTEMALVKICGEIFNVNQVSVTDTLFMLGASSVNIMRFVTAVNGTLGTNLTLADVFENRGLELRELTAINSGQWNQKETAAILPAPYARSYPIAPAQKRIYILQSMDQDSTIYNITRAVEITGDITNQRIEQELIKLIHRHEIFRTSFFMNEREISQSIAETVDFGFEFMTCETGNDLFGVIQSFRCPFNLSEAPLLRVGIVQSQDGRRVLVLDVHHIIIDGRSLDRAITEFCLSLAGVPSMPEAVTYKDYTVWQQKHFTAGRLHAIEQYWKKRLGSLLPVLEISCSYKRPLVFTGNGGHLHGKMTAELRNKVSQTAQRCHTTEFIVLLAVYYILLGKYTGQRDIVVGTVTNGRNLPEIQNTLGMFVNTIPLKNSIDPDEVADQFISRLHESVYKDLQYQDLSFESMVELLGIVRDSSRNPLFDVMFVCQEETQQQANIEGSAFTLLDMPNPTAKCDITLELTPVGDQYSYTLEYCTDLFDLATVRCMMDHYFTLLDELCSKTGILTGDVSCVAEHEHQRLLAYSQKAGMIGTNRSSVIERFAGIVRRHGSQTAVVDGKSELTYKELDQDSNRLAAKICAKGVGKGDFVCIIAAHSMEMIVAAIAVLKCGAAYVPIDSQLPAERINYILSDCCAKLLLSDGSAIAEHISLKAESISELLYIYPRQDIPNPSDLGHSPAYVIYTSGSAGKPKGVVITHVNLLTYIDAFEHYVIDKENFTMAQLASFAFDVSAEEIFGTILNGGRLVLVNKKQMLDLNTFNNILAEYQVDYFSITPAFAGLLNRYAGLYHVRSIIVGGDIVMPHHVNELEKHARIINSYGPTETCIGATYCQFDPQTHTESIPIGAPLPGYNVYVLNQQNQLCGFNIPGEICIAGRAVSPGYMNAELNGNRFLPDPFSGANMYRSGDAGFMREDGNIEFIARLDDQIKLRGYRIERDEIMHTAVSTGLVQDFTVDLFETTSGENVLCGAYVAEYDVSDRLKKSMAKSIPGYMIPEILIRFESLPVTVNGKIDRNVLASKFAHESAVKHMKEPSTDNERVLAEIWGNALGKDTVPINMSFWELGGNSISAVSMILAAANRGYKINIHDIFSNATIAEIAADHSNARKHVASVQDICSIIFEQTGIMAKVLDDEKDALILHLDAAYSLQLEEDIFAILNKNVLSSAKLKNITWGGGEKAEQEGKEAQADLFNVFSNSFALKRVADEQSLISPSQYYYIVIDEQYCTDMITIEGYFSRRQFCMAVDQLINSQQMLRAGYRKSNAVSAKVIFYEPEQDLQIPYIDLLPCSSSETAKQLKKLDDLLCGNKPDRVLPYKMVAVRTALNKHSLRLYIHHAFYDMFSGVAMKSNLEQFLWHRKSNIAEKLPEKPLKSINADALARVFRLEEFCDSSHAFATKSENFKKGHARFIQKYPLPSHCNEAMIINKAVESICKFFSQLYNTDKLPFWMIYHGRGISDEADFSSVGSFIDVIPFLWAAEGNSDFTVELREKIDILQTGNISFGRILLNKEPSLERSTLVKQMRKLVFKQFVAINYQGKERYSIDGINNETAQKINLKKNIAIVSYNDTEIKITYDLPIEYHMEAQLRVSVSNSSREEH